MPILNSYWAKYGCTKCNTYKLLVLEVDANDTKETFISAIINKYGVTCPTVAQGEGGEQLFNSVKNDLNSAGVFYLIKPDKTLKEMPSATEINNAGGNVQHVCPTDIKTDKHYNDAHGIMIRSLIAGKLDITVRNADTYTIAIHSANGKLISSLRTQLKQGDNSVVLQNATAFGRVVVVSVNSEKGSITKKIVQYQ